MTVQQGRHVASVILSDVSGKPREDFRFVDKGQMATIGRNRAVVEIGKFQFAGRFAWLTWLAVHIYFLTGSRTDSSWSSAGPGHT